MSSRAGRSKAHHFARLNQQDYVVGFARATQKKFIKRYLRNSYRQEVNDNGSTSLGQVAYYWSLIGGVLID